LIFIIAQMLVSPIVYAQSLEDELRAQENISNQKAIVEQKKRHDAQELNRIVSNEAVFLICPLLATSADVYAFYEGRVYYGGVHYDGNFEIDYAKPYVRKGNFITWAGPITKPYLLTWETKFELKLDDMHLFIKHSSGWINELVDCRFKNGNP
jgi:hypothetical protein